MIASEMVAMHYFSTNCALRTLNKQPSQVIFMHFYLQASTLQTFKLPVLPTCKTAFALSCVL